MAKLTLTHAAATTGVNRSTLHRAVKDGRLSREPDGRFDTAELLRAGFALRAPAPEAPGAPEPALPAPPEPPRPVLALTLEPERQRWERERALLVQALDAAQAREAASREREAQRLQLLQADQQQRLLPAGSPAAPRGLRGWLWRWLQGT